MADLPDFINFLLQPEAYSHPVAETRLVQTHISYVILAGDYVYKFKKPVDFGFLDFTTLEQRKYFCEQEVILNRSLCPDIYLGKVTVTSDGESLTLDGAGDPLEYGVRMARMPEEGMMANFIGAGRLCRDHIDRIVATLVPFYDKAAGDQAIREFGRADTVAVNVLENFEQTEGFVGCQALSRDRFERISRWARDFLGRTDLFDDRISRGRIRDCHGDLYSANICFDGDRVHIFDCIEFNERFRYCDVASDVAFLAMDLDFHGLEELSVYFIRQFARQAGDDTLDSMLRFYKGYRAYVRGKIGLFTAHDPKVDAATRDSCLVAAKKYFELAERYAS